MKHTLKFVIPFAAAAAIALPAQAARYDSTTSVKKADTQQTVAKKKSGGKRSKKA